ILQTLAFLGPFTVVVVEDLGHRAPPDVFDQSGFFFFGCSALLGVQHPQSLNGFEILLELLLRPAVPQAIGFRDAVTLEISRRLVLVATRYSSGGRRMYFSRTISQAWS